MQQLKETIELAFEDRANIIPSTVNPTLVSAINTILKALDDGSLRVAQKQNGVWVVNEWVKKSCFVVFQGTR